MMMILVDLELDIGEILDDEFTLIGHFLDAFDDGGLFLEVELFEVDENFGGLLGEEEGLGLLGLFDAAVGGLEGGGQFVQGLSLELRLV